MLHHHPAQTATLSIQAEDAAKIEAEMQTVVADINKRLRERRRTR
jgi:hypothetical protein